MNEVLHWFLLVAVTVLALTAFFGVQTDERQNEAIGALQEERGR